MVMGIKHCGSTKFCSIVFLQLCRYRDGRAVRLDAGPDGIQLLPRVHEVFVRAFLAARSGVCSLDIFVSASRALRERQRGRLECADAQQRAALPRCADPGRARSVSGKSLSLENATDVPSEIGVSSQLEGKAKRGALCLLCTHSALA